MESKTPKFDNLLDEILKKIVPHERECIQKDISKYCEKKFKIYDEDINFYKLLRVPPPKCCPTCRRQRRNAFTNRINLYKRKDNTPESTKDIISFVPPVSPFVVYNLDYYRSAKWDQASFAKNYDFSVPFFDQFFDLRQNVPQYAIVRDPSSINSEYSLNGKNLKNGYLVSGGTNSENLWYSIFIKNSKEVMDSHSINNCERCYEMILTRNMSLCFFCYFSFDCIDSYFLFDCRNCQNCFGCMNLRNKKYCFFNQQLSKEEYQEKIESLKLYSRSGLKDAKNKFWEFVKSNPVRASRSSQAINSSGTLIINSKNCHNVISCDNGENERYVNMVTNHKDSMDVYTSGDSELLYEVSWVGADASNIKFSFGSKNVTNCEFIINCHYCDNCFACIGLENKKYHIFNRPYDKDEYFKELDKIKSSLLEKGEYGEFLPYRFSTFAYNGSEADIYFPLNKEETEKIEAYYQPDIEIETGGIEILETKNIPDSIFDVNDDIFNKAIICEKTGRPFRIVKSELEFYRRFKLPIPTLHPLARMKGTYWYLVGDNVIYNDTCKKCGIFIETIYNPKQNWCPYCEKCYQQEVY